MGTWAQASYCATELHFCSKCCWFVGELYRSASMSIVCSLYVYVVVYSYFVADEDLYDYD